MWLNTEFVLGTSHIYRAWLKCCSAWRKRMHFWALWVSKHNKYFWFMMFVLFSIVLYDIKPLVGHVWAWPQCWCLFISILWCESMTLLLWLLRTFKMRNIDGKSHKHMASPSTCLLNRKNKHCHLLDVQKTSSAVSGVVIHGWQCLCSTSMYFVL